MNPETSIQTNPDEAHQLESGSSVPPLNLRLAPNPADTALNFGCSNPYERARPSTSKAVSSRQATALQSRSQNDALRDEF
jgi:hypothetical protein